jgi:hypothetical protein
MSRNKKQTRKEQLNARSIRYCDRSDQFNDSAAHWRNGYRAALKDVRRAAGRCGIPSRLMKLLRPIR